MDTALMMFAPADHVASSPLASATQTSPTAEARWRQVLARDRTADGSFVYAVRSTGIFCRPTCASRRPARSRVSFFDSAAAAVVAGYRPCLRCQPDTERGDGEARDAAIVAAVLRVMERNGSERVSLAALGRATGETGSAILRAFRRMLQTTPARYARHRRMETFRASLASEAVSERDGGRTPRATRVSRAVRITDAIQDAGFGSSSRLYEASGAALGMTPTAFQEGGDGTVIAWTILDSPLGRTLVAATEVGVCAISFADRDDLLLTELHGRFPRATLVDAQASQTAAAKEKDAAEEGPRRARVDGPAVARWLAEAAAFVLGELSESPAAVTFPLHVRATAFQERVWQALRELRRGETVSYAGLARRLGVPAGARAVASACARNPVALAIPCHRVVAGSGSLAGYRWGLERKEALLMLEVAGGSGEGGGSTSSRGATQKA